MTLLNMTLCHPSCLCNHTQGQVEHNHVSGMVLLRVSMCVYVCVCVPTCHVHLYLQAHSVQVVALLQAQQAVTG